MESKALQTATERASDWQYKGNVALERGDRVAAEKAFEKSQYWRDRMNRLLGNM